VSEFKHMVSIPEIYRNQLLEYIADDDKMAWSITGMVDALMHAKRVDESPALGPILAALGWSGGTVEQVVAEVGRLVTSETALLSSLVDLHGVRNRACARHLIHDRRPHLEGCPYCQLIGKTIVNRESRPPDPGVAALLPEHGEAKR